MLLKGNCLETLKNLKTASVDSIVTDPPYELGFMGKSWDNSGIAYNQDLWAECLRVLKPGGHLLAFGGSRTYHRLASAVEDSGFEIRDQIMWLYGSGFPKSHNIGKAIDKKAGAPVKVGKRFTVAGGIEAQPTPQGEAREEMRHKAITPEAQQWNGWGTALKPSHEPVVVARKPFEGTVANNVLTYGTGALNIDGSRVGMTQSDAEKSSGNWKPQGYKVGENIYELGTNVIATEQSAQGRWPANVIHDGSDEVLAGFPTAKGGTWNTTAGARHFNNDGEPTLYETSKTDNSSGSAARFFYCAKASKSERNAGLEGLPERESASKGNGLARTCATCGAGTLEGCDCPDRTFENPKRQNFHPTVKPLALMRYLIKLVTPPNGIVLDPFLGSGTTAVAATLEGFDWIGCEMTEDYFPIIEARVEWAQVESKKTPTTLF